MADVTVSERSDDLKYSNSPCQLTVTAKPGRLDVDQ